MIKKPFTIQFPENPISGFSWDIATSSGLQVMRDSFVPVEEGNVGGGGYHVTPWSPSSYTLPETPSPAKPDLPGFAGGHFITFQIFSDLYYLISHLFFPLISRFCKLLQPYLLKLSFLQAAFVLTCGN